MIKFRLEWFLETNKKTRLWSPFPITDSNQELLNYEFTKKPKKLVLTDNYNYAYFESNKDFMVKLHLEMDVRSFRSYDAPKPKKYLEIEPLMLSEEAKKLAKKLKTPKAFYKWIIENIKFPEIKFIEKKLLTDLRYGCYSVQEVLESMAGECGGKSLLFVSLCRYVGIPARIVQGYFLKEGKCKIHGMKLGPSLLDVHEWVEFYEKGKWYPVDCNIAQQSGKVYFGQFDDLRIAICKGTNIKLYNKKEPVYSLQMGFFDQAKNLTLSLKFES